MARFLIDEDLPRGVARSAPARGVDAVHVVDAGLRGAPDPGILAEAVSAGRSVVTADKEFANVIVYPPEKHAGVVLIRIPDEMDPDQRIARIVDVLVVHAADDLAGVIVVVEPNRVRIRTTRV